MAVAATCPPAGAQQGQWNDLLEIGRQLWEEYAPAEIKEHYEFPTQESVERFLADLEHALAEGSLEELAAYDAEARSALALLRQFHGGDELAAWLEPRLDFLRAAKDSMETHPPQEAVPLAPPPPDPEARPYWDQIAVSREPPARARELVPRLKSIFESEGIPPEWVWIAEVESSMNPMARSPVGARGLFQFMPATAERFGMRTTRPDDRTDPEMSARAAAQYLRFLHGRFGSWPLSLAAYNAGEGRVGRALQASGVSTFTELASHLPAETRLYVPKVLATVAAREGVTNPEQLPPPAR